MMDLGAIGWGGVDWISMAQDRDRRRALVNAVMNHRVHKMLENYRVASQLVASRAELSPIEFLCCHNLRTAGLSLIHILILRSLLIYSSCFVIYKRASKFNILEFKIMRQ
jgi:hypothetical protein